MDASITRLYSQYVITRGKVWFTKVTLKLESVGFEKNQYYQTTYELSSMHPSGGELLMK